MRIVIPSLNYADFLAVTLPAWCQIADPDEIRIVTHLGDQHTIDVAHSYGCRIVATTAWHADGARLNKSLAMDEAFDFIPPSASSFSNLPNREPPDLHELCLALDADCYPVGRLPDPATIEPKVIYGCHRYICETSDILAGCLNGSFAVEKMREVVSWGRRVRNSHHRDCPQVACGYFQLFRYARQMRFGSFPAANEYDVQFAFKFPRSGLLTSIHVLHLGLIRLNWQGRTTDRWPTHEGT
jgi:hypothetical protein